MLGTLAQLAGRVGGDVVGDGSLSFTGIAATDEATPADVTFAVDAHYFANALASRAGAVLVDAAVARDAGPAGKPLLVVPDVRAALASLLALLRIPRPPVPFRHPTAVVDPDARVADDVHLGAGSYVGARASIARGVVLGAGAYVGDDTTVGENAWLHPRSTVLERCTIGKRVVLHPGCVIGSEGFGWAVVEGRLERIPQVGNVVLDDDVEVGANTCIDRAQTGSTRIGEGTKIDNLVQIGHNCRIGKHSAFAALTGLAGSTIVGDHVQVAGQCGFKGHITVGSRVTIAGQTGVWGDVPDGAMVSGNPARDHRENLRREVMLRKLPKLIARVESLERERSPHAE